MLKPTIYIPSPLTKLLPLLQLRIRSGEAGKWGSGEECQGRLSMRLG